MAASFHVTANLTDFFSKTIREARIRTENGRIVDIAYLSAEPNPSLPYLLPGFIDSHVHIESSMLTPPEFARLAVVHGTVGTVSDPHEIANVCGMDGVDYMIREGKKVPFHFCFGAPSCVPATTFETAGARLDVSDVALLLQNPHIGYLSEMMNFPGVLNGEPEVLQKIEAAKAAGKPVDGHAPGLLGEDALRYIQAGISTDHECFTREEALHKLRAGMHILIREGSAARNFDALIELLHEYPEQIMFCSDDKHPDSLVEGHINQLCARAIEKGHNLFDVLQAACINPVLHYQIPVGLLRLGDPADFILVNNLRAFQVLQTYIRGEKVAENGKSLIPRAASGRINQFYQRMRSVDELACTDVSKANPAIRALNGQLITEKVSWNPRVLNGQVMADPEQDIVKMVVINRYHEAPPAIGFLQNTGIKKGAIAGSVAHDSHNIVAAGVDDASICRAINLVIAASGGLSAVNGNDEQCIPLPVAGLMSDDDGYTIAEAYSRMDTMVKESMGSTLASPFMTLSFMSLLVIPHIKLSDLGMFDGDAFRLYEQT